MVVAWERRAIVGCPGGRGRGGLGREEEEQGPRKGPLSPALGAGTCAHTHPLGSGGVLVSASFYSNRLYFTCGVGQIRYNHVNAIHVSSVIYVS